MLVKLAAEWIERLGLQFGKPQEKIIKQILYYIYLRQFHAALKICGPYGTMKWPTGWHSEEEIIWQEWLGQTLTIEGWQSLLSRVFGDEICDWEQSCAGWRLEVLQILPAWIMRDPNRFDQIDPRPLPDEDEEETDPSKMKIDPYLLEHGGSKGRRLRGGHTAGIDDL